MLCSEQYGQMLGTIRNKVRKLQVFKAKEQVLEEQKRAIARLKRISGGSYYLQKYHPEEVSQ